MNRRDLLATSAAALAATALPAQARPTGASMSQGMPIPPVAKKIPVRIEQLGRVRTDDYQWMKDDNWQAVLRDPTLIKADVKEHLEAENAYREAMMVSTLPLQAAMFEEMKGGIKEADSSVPSPDGPWEYYVEYRTGDQHPRYMRQPRGGGTAQLLLDANALAEGKAYSEVSAAEHSPDHALFAYAEDAQGSEVHQIFVRDLATGEVLPDPIGSAYGGFAFSPDSQWIFWTNRDDNGRPDRIFRRPARGGETTLVYQEEDDGLFMSVGRTADDAFVLISIANQETSETRVIPAATLTATPVVLEPRQVGRLYDADHWGDRWVIRTNADDSIDFKIVEAPTATPGKAHWADLVAHTDNIKPERTPEDLLFQVLVDWGVDLSLPITQETVAKKKVFFVDGNALDACFDPKVSEDLVKELAKRKPLRAVFRDSSYDSDSVKINVEQIFKLLSPETEVKSL
jgi:oligopeptidase B